MKRPIAITLILLLCISLWGCAPKQSCDDEPFETWNNEDEPIAACKPVIYLYPEVTQQVTANLDFKGQLTCTYPAYQKGWTVTAAPDGTLTDANGQQYNYLYWEGKHK